MNNKIENSGICNLVFNVTNLKLIDYKGINKLLYNYEIDREWICWLLLFTRKWTRI